MLYHRPPPRISCLIVSVSSLANSARRASNKESPLSLVGSGYANLGLLQGGGGFVLEREVLVLR